MIMLFITHNIILYSIYDCHHLLFTTNIFAHIVITDFVIFVRGKRKNCNNTYIFPLHLSCFIQRRYVLVLANQKAHILNSV